MIHTTPDNDSVVLALADAPTDPRTGNKTLYAVNWKATGPSMIGQRNEDWVRRELDWFRSGSDRLIDMEPPVPALFEACAGTDGRVNSAYGHILFHPDVVGGQSLYQRILRTFQNEGYGTRHAVAIISDRDVHRLHRLNGRNDFICTNALNVMIDENNHLHIIAQMRSMDAVFGYRADYSMWDDLMALLLGDLAEMNKDGREDAEVVRGDIIFQVANLHVYPRHFDLLRDTAEDTHERLNRRIWQRMGEHFPEAVS